MKLTLSQYEGGPDFVAFTCEMPNDAKLDDVVENLESLLRCCWGNDVVLECTRKAETPGGLRSAVHAAMLGRDG